MQRIVRKTPAMVLVSRSICTKQVVAAAATAQQTQARCAINKQQRFYSSRAATAATNKPQQQQKQQQAAPVEQKKQILIHGVTVEGLTTALALKTMNAPFQVDLVDANKQYQTPDGMLHVTQFSYVFTPIYSQKPFR